MTYKHPNSPNESFLRVQQIVWGLLGENTLNAMGESNDVQLDEYIKKTSHSIKDYTLKLKKKKVEKYDDVDIDDDVTIYHYDILLNKKVVGEIREDDRTGDGYGKLHGKNLPGGYGGGGVGAFHAFLKSKLFKKWSTNVKFFKDNPLVS